MTVDFSALPIQTTTLGGAPEGQDARLLAELARSRGTASLIHVASDDARAERLADLIAFFDPTLKVRLLPAWDCLPYDRVSPNGAIIARRVDTLTRIVSREARGAKAPFLLITTVNALTQRLPAPSVFRGAVFSAKIGDRLDLDRLYAYLARNGFTRAQTVREPGEFAVRGNIIDVYPPGQEEPFRLDLFDDEVDGIRAFDPMTQRSLAKRKRVQLIPMGEVFLDEANINRFRSGYRAAFGAVNDEDPLYAAISEGRRHAGMEHWLPLFHEKMATVLDYLPDAAVGLDHQALTAAEARFEQIREFYDARRHLMEVEKKAKGSVYKALPPDSLYLDQGSLHRLLDTRPVVQLSPFAGTVDTGTSKAGGGKKGRDFADIRAQTDENVFDALRIHVRDLARGGRRVLIAGYSAGARDRFLQLVKEHGLEEAAALDAPEDLAGLDPKTVGVIVLPLESGFVADDLAVITEQDVLGDRFARAAKKRKRKADAFISEVSALAPGDFVVHVEHGIARYEGLETLTVAGAPHDCLKLVYAGEDKLFVPVENIETLSRFGSEAGGAQLDRLGGGAWQARRAQVKQRLKDMADELIRVAAAREVRTGEQFAATDGFYQEFAARFPYPETDDQLRAIGEVLEDLSSGRPMDRLVCGDVGFGKTEVALRAAFVVAAGGGQVALVVPTTLLARQHFRTFETRFAGMPIRIGQLSRMVSTKDAKLVRDELEAGTLDIVVGTHAVLAQSVKFKRLQMVIVDEEQHFGVKQKERLKALKEDVHVLTLTATPIPRTLQLALAGVRELSLIATPPVDRLAVRTFVLPYDGLVIREAILREHFRGGQTYYVCPRLADLERVAEQLRVLVPEVKIVIAHGRLAATAMEEVMTAFYDGKFDVLLSTTIVESGLDVPSANTMIIHRADMFGLAQLYQLRGRIGRSKLRGYAYFTYAPTAALSEVAKQRLHVIETLDSLGAGFSLASHDMDIRGAGNLLGEEQSGHIKEVGVELYQQMLEEAISAAKQGLGDDLLEDRWSPTINLGMAVMIPEAYVPDLNVRLDLYRRLAELETREELDGFAAELIDRFGKLPPEVETLLQLTGVKALCKRAGIDRLDAGPKGAVLAFRNNRFAKPERLIEFIGKQAGAMKLRPDHKLVCPRGWDLEETRLKGVRRLAEQLADLAA